MNNTQKSQRFLKQRKFLLVLPLLVIPFLTIIFAALGGGKTDAVNSTASHAGNNLNVALPDAQFRKTPEKNKLGLYEQMSKDSARLLDEMAKDPHLVRPPGMTFSPFDAGESLSAAGGHFGYGPTDSNEQRINKKLAELKLVLQRQAPVMPTSAYEQPTNENEKLERLLQAIHARQTTPDPEMAEINSMLDKLQQLQNPVTVPDSPAIRSNQQPAMPVEAPQTDDASVLQNASNSSTQQFLGLDNDEETNSGGNAFEAIIEGKQVLVSGATVRLKLSTDLIVKQTLIRAGQLIYGTAKLNDERLRISIPSIRTGNIILPVALEVYDSDGMQGIYVPGSITRDISKQSADQSLGAIGMTSLDPSIGAQVTSAGIQAAKSLMSKKIKLVRVTVPAGYRVWLKDNSR